MPSPQILLPSNGLGQMPIGESTFATPASYNEDQFTLNVDDKISEKNQFAAEFLPFARANDRAIFTKRGDCSWLGNNRA